MLKESDSKWERNGKTCMCAWEEELAIVNINHFQIYSGDKLNKLGIYLRIHTYFISGEDWIFSPLFLTFDESLTSFTLTCKLKWKISFVIIWSNKWKMLSIEKGPTSKTSKRKCSIKQPTSFGCDSIFTRIQLISLIISVYSSEWIECILHNFNASGKSAVIHKEKWYYDCNETNQFKMEHRISVKLFDEEKNIFIWISKEKLHLVNLAEIDWFLKYFNQNRSSQWNSIYQYHFPCTFSGSNNGLFYKSISFWTRAIICMVKNTVQY